MMLRRMFDLIDFCCLGGLIDAASADGLIDAAAAAV